MPPAVTVAPPKRLEPLEVVLLLAGVLGAGFILVMLGVFLVMLKWLPNPFAIHYGILSSGKALKMADGKPSRKWLIVPMALALLWMVLVMALAWFFT